MADDENAPFLLFQREFGNKSLTGEVGEWGMDLLKGVQKYSFIRTPLKCCQAARLLALENCFNNVLLPSYPVILNQNGDWRGIWPQQFPQ